MSPGFGRQKFEDFQSPEKEKPDYAEHAQSLEGFSQAQPVNGHTLLNDRTGDFHSGEKLRGMCQSGKDNDIPFAQNAEHH